MKIPSEGIEYVLRNLEWRCQNRGKYTILGHFLENFGILKGGKVSPHDETENFYLLNIFMYSSI
jgi:hypothetical protein